MDKSESLRVPLSQSTYKGLGPALMFDGSNDNAPTTTAASDLAMTGAFTAEVTARRISNTGDVPQFLMGKEGNYAVGLNVSGEVNASYWVGVTQHDLSTTHVLSSSNHEVIQVVWNGTIANSKLYIDGVDQGATYGTSTVTVDLTNEISFGANIAGNANRANVQIAEARRWDGERTVAELKQYMHEELTGSEANLKAYWPFNEGTGSTLNDLASGGHDITITGATWQHTLEGDSSLRGQLKPVTVGSVLNRPCVAVDPGNLVYQVHDGSASTISAVYINAKEISLSSAGDVTDIWASTPDIDKYITDKSKGLIRLGTNYDSSVAITADLVGDDTGTDAKYPAAVAERLLLSYGGMSSSEIDSSAISALDTELGTTLEAGLAPTHEATEVLSHLDPLFHPLTSYWTFNRDGEFTVGRIKVPEDETAIATLDENAVNVDGMRLLNQVPPIWKASIGVSRFWRVHSPGDTDATLDTVDQERAQRQYSHVEREDADIRADYLERVRVSDGYIVPTTLSSNVAIGPEAQRHLDLFGELRQVYEVPLGKVDYSYNLGDVVALDFSGMTKPAFGISSATNFLVAGIDEGEGYSTLVLWG